MLGAYAASAASDRFRYLDANRQSGRQRSQHDALIFVAVPSQFNGDRIVTLFVHYFPVIAAIEGMMIAKKMSDMLQTWRDVTNLGTRNLCSLVGSIRKS